MQRLDGSYPTVDEVIAAAIDTCPLVAEEGKRDTRPQHIGRAFKQLVSKRKLQIEAGRVVPIGDGTTI
jgi:hypothetical protein